MHSFTISQFDPEEGDSEFKVYRQVYAVCLLWDRTLDIYFSVCIKYILFNSCIDEESG